MIGDWLAAWPAFAAAFAVLFAPGLAMGLLLRLRGLTLWALAPIASTAVLAVLAIVLAVIGVPWSVGSILAGCAAAIAIVGVGSIALGPRRPVVRTPRWQSHVLTAGFGVGIVLGAVRFGLYVGDPAAISQTNDAVFHLNALRWIMDTGSASSFDLNGFLGASGFYPGAWHALVSATALISGAEIPVAVNAVALMIGVAVWPVGVAWFTRVVSHGSASATAFAAALSPSLGAFPMLMFQWGVLYPYALSVALLPAAAAVVVGIPAWLGAAGPVVGRTRNAVLAAVIALTGVGALALAQPATVLAWLILVGVWASWWGAGRVRTAVPRTRALAVGLLVLLWIMVAAIWYLLARSTTGSHWPPFRSKLASIVDVVLNGQVMLPYAIGVSVLMIVGIVMAVRRPRLRWLATAWFIVAGLYAVAASIGNPWLRTWLLGAWYADPYRLAALAPVVVVPLAAIGLAAVASWARRALARGERVPSPERAAGVALGAIALVGAAALLVAPIVQMPRVIEGIKDDQSRYASTPEGFLSPDERALLERLDQHVDEDARVIANPSTGSGFGYMLSGRDVLPRTWSHPSSPEWDVLTESLRDAAEMPAVCDALAAFGSPEYVLDFGPGEQSPGRYLAPGMTDFAGRDGFELVDEIGDASLWRITACR